MSNLPQILKNSDVAAIDWGSTSLSSASIHTSTSTTTTTDEPSTPPQFIPPNRKERRRRLALARSKKK